MRKICPGRQDYAEQMGRDSSATAYTDSTMPNPLITKRNDRMWKNLLAPARKRWYAINSSSDVDSV